MKHFHLIISLIIFPFFSAQAENGTIKPTIRLAAYEYPPLYHTSIGGEFSGTIGETIKKMSEVGGSTLQTTMFPLARSYELVNKGLLDATLSGVHPKFDQCCKASQWSYPWSAGLFAKSSQTKIPTTEEEMIGHSVIIVKGWRSPYRFMPNLDKLIAEKKIKVFYPLSNFSAIKMLENGRADFLWGAVDFLWYLRKMDLIKNFSYHERLKIPIVMWVNKSKPSVLDSLDSGYKILKQQKMLDEQNLLIPDLMKKNYKEATFKKTQ